MVFQGLLYVNLTYRRSLKYSTTHEGECCNIGMSEAEPPTGSGEGYLSDKEGGRGVMKHGCGVTMHHIAM